MFPSMIFGMAVLGSIIIPLGFHFLTLLGGKAVFIAKMAFLVAIITSMKKVEFLPFLKAIAEQSSDHDKHIICSWQRSAATWACIIRMVQCHHRSIHICRHHPNGSEAEQWLAVVGMTALSQLLECINWVDAFRCRILLRYKRLPLEINWIFFVS